MTFRTSATAEQPNVGRCCRAEVDQEPCQLGQPGMQQLSDSLCDHSMMQVLARSWHKGTAAALFVPKLFQSRSGRLLIAGQQGRRREGKDVQARCTGEIALQPFWSWEKVSTFTNLGGDRKNCL